MLKVELISAIKFDVGIPISDENTVVLPLPTSYQPSLSWVRFERCSIIGIFTFPQVSTAETLVDKGLNKDAP